MGIIKCGSGSTDPKTHGSDHITVFESWIRSHFRLARIKKIVWEYQM